MMGLEVVTTWLTWETTNIKLQGVIVKQDSVIPQNHVKIENIF